MPLGSFFGVTYDEVTFPLVRGDVFVFCSDGVSEAMNSKGEEFTQPRLIDVVERTQAPARRARSSRPSSRRSPNTAPASRPTTT